MSLKLSGEKENRLQTLGHQAQGGVRCRIATSKPTASLHPTRASLGLSQMQVLGNGMPRLEKLTAPAEDTHRIKGCGSLQ